MQLQNSDYLALIYVNKNAEKGQSASEMYEMYLKAKTEFRHEINKQRENAPKPKIKATII